MDTYTPSGSQDHTQGEFRQVLYWKLTDSLARMAWIQLFGFIVFLLSGGLFLVLAFRLGKMPPAFEINTPAILVALAGMVGIIILHEIVHGLTMRLFGARPIYGVLWKGLAFYATSPGFAFRRNAYLVVALAPFVLLSLLSVLAIFLLQGTTWVMLVVVCAVINASGAAGDLWMAGILLRYPHMAYVVDERDGMRILLPLDNQKNAAR